jgi:hypothetical protein
MNRKTASVLAVLGLVVATVAFWRLDSSTRPPVSPDIAVGVHPGQPSAGASSSSLGASAGDKVVDAEPMTNELPDGEPAAPAAPGASAKPTVGDILAEPDDDYVRVAKKLIAITLDPKAPMVEREEALAHALNLAAGSEAEVLTPLVKNPNLPDELADTVLSEALNRPLSYQADLYLAALAVRKSPEMQTKIREHLTFLVGDEDKGPNPADWADAIKAAKASWPQ